MLPLIAMQTKCVFVEGMPPKHFVKAPDKPWRFEGGPGLLPTSRFPVRHLLTLPWAAAPGLGGGGSSTAQEAPSSQGRHLTQEALDREDVNISRDSRSRGAGFGHRSAHVMVLSHDLGPFQPLCSALMSPGADPCPDCQMVASDLWAKVPPYSHSPGQDRETSFLTVGMVASSLIGPA